MNQMSADHHKLRNVLITKLGLPTDRFHRDNQIAEAVQGVIHGRDEALQLRSAYNSNVEDWRELCSHFNLPVSELSAILNAIENMRTDRDMLTELSADLRTQRDALYERLAQVIDVTGEPTLEELVGRVIGELTQTREAATDFNQELLDLFTDEVCDALGLENGFTPEQFHAALGVSRPHDKRYIVHGDIQPCVVLYSDETTTLVRLDENDMMCETSTIEWSDELTYRCQEMLKSESVRKDAVFVRHATPVLAQLVRSGHVTLNGLGPVYFRDENAIQAPVDGTNWDSGSSPTQQR